MFGSEILEVAIGLVLVYLLLALVCSAISEWIARMFATRSKTLKAGIRNLLDGPDADQKLADDIYGHPLVKGLYLKGRWDRFKDRLPKLKGNEGPSNIPTRTFALALFDSMAKTDDDDGDSAKLRSAKNQYRALMAGVDNLATSKDVKRVLKTLLQSAALEADGWDDALVKARASVEGWFDDSMDRVSGWYKRQTQLIVLALALGVTLAMNADTFMIADSLWHDPAARELVVAAAAGTAQQTTDGGDQAASDLAKLQKEIDNLPLPFGWVGEGEDDPRARPGNEKDWAVKLLGIAFTAFAVALGAPFWFDLLNKFVSLRGSGATPPRASGSAAPG